MTWHEAEVYYAQLDGYHTAERYGAARISRARAVIAGVAGYDLQQAQAFGRGVERLAREEHIHDIYNPRT